MSRHVEYCVQCDCCGKDGCHSGNGHDVRLQMRRTGWIASRVVIGERHALVDLCPACADGNREEAIALAEETVIRSARIVMENKPTGARS